MQAESISQLSRPYWETQEYKTQFYRGSGEGDDYKQEEWRVQDLPVEERERMYEMLDPKTKEHLIW